MAHNILPEVSPLWSCLLLNWCYKANSESRVAHLPLSVLKSNLTVQVKWMWKEMQSKAQRQSFTGSFSFSVDLYQSWATLTGMFNNVENNFMYFKPCLYWKAGNCICRGNGTWISIKSKCQIITCWLHFGYRISLYVTNNAIKIWIYGSWWKWF